MLIVLRTAPVTMVIVLLPMLKTRRGRFWLLDLEDRFHEGCVCVCELGDEVSKYSCLIYVCFFASPTTNLARRIRSDLLALC